LPHHGGTIDTTRANLVWNWVVPILLVSYGVKRSTAAQDDASHA
jgi:hypothetical protein